MAEISSVLRRSCKITSSLKESRSYYKDQKPDGTELDWVRSSFWKGTKQMEFFLSVIGLLQENIKAADAAIGKVKEQWPNPYKEIEKS